jgi:hypothetical protein
MRIIIKIILKIGIKEYKVRALVNLRAKVNYLKRKLVIEINALVIRKGITLLILLNRKRIYSYINYIIIIITKDI